MRRSTTYPKGGHYSGVESKVAGANSAAVYMPPRHRGSAWAKAMTRAATHGEEPSVCLPSSPPASRCWPVLRVGQLGSKEREQIIRLAAKHRLPAIYEWREHVEAGGLMAYGGSLSAFVRRAAVLRRSYFQRREPCRPARGARDHFRASDQPEDRQGPRPDDPAVVASAAAPPVDDVGRHSPARRRPSCRGGRGRRPRHRGRGSSQLRVVKDEGFGSGQL